ncbi:MAG TPA: tRNA pseudouridine(38-40) synthase TruA [Thermoanaerobaculia bacterium]|jgi:tRNA pseudouridine38-40 synthase|nr:tRNA pseudouridine(38-40) synthase TruA [Thermoanaerobaculia bacterium]
MATYRLTLEYDGTRYHGWQVQQNARSVAGELHRALAAAGAEVVELGGSGRTDAGVHALAQVAHLRLRRRADPEGLRRELNDRLPPDVHVLALVPAADRFHARHDALSRSYLYQIATRRTAFHKRFVWWVRKPLDLDAMRAAAAELAGRHDFRAFCERPQEQTSTLVEVATVELVPAEALVLVRLVASHFLWKMVRRLVGALVRVGWGEQPVEMVRALLAGEAGAAGLAPAEWTAPPSGLFLERVLYAGEPPLSPPVPVTPLSWPLPPPTGR